MQVEVDLKYMQTIFGGRGPSGFGDSALFSFAFKTAYISLWTIDYCPCKSLFVCACNVLAYLQQNNCFHYSEDGELRSDMRVARPHIQLDRYGEVSSTVMQNIVIFCSKVMICEAIFWQSSNNHNY